MPSLRLHTSSRLHPRPIAPCPSSSWPLKHQPPMCPSPPLHPDARTHLCLTLHTPRPVLHPAFLLSPESLPNAPSPSLPTAPALALALWRVGAGGWPLQRLGLCRHHGDGVRGAWAPGCVAAAGEGPCTCGLEGGGGPAAGQRPQLPGAWPVGGAGWVGRPGWPQLWLWRSDPFLNPHAGPGRSFHGPPLLTHSWGSHLP